MHKPSSFHILVTDTNHHVRDLLKRELEQDGYTVHSIKAAVTAWEYICSKAPLDLIILDPELFYPCDRKFVQEMLHHRDGSLDIIIHTYEDSLLDLKRGQHIHLVEKNAQSAESIRKIIHDCFCPVSSRSGIQTYLNS